MDGTLVNSDAVVERCWRRWATDHGLDPEEALKVVHGRQGYATMAVLLPDRPMEENYADNRVMLARETADVDGVVPVGGAPAFMAAIAGLPHALVTSADSALAAARMGRRRAADARGARDRRTGVGQQAGPRGLPQGRGRAGLRGGGLHRVRGLRGGHRGRPGGGMRVVGVGPRAAALAPDAHVDDLTRIRVEATEDGTIRLHIAEH